MVDLLISLVSGGNGLLVVLAAIFAAVTAAYLKGRSAALTSQIAKERDAYERHLEDLTTAAGARNRVQPSDSVQSDPYRRD